MAAAESNSYSESENDDAIEKSQDEIDSAMKKHLELIYDRALIDTDKIIRERKHIIYIPDMLDIPQTIIDNYTIMENNEDHRIGLQIEKAKGEDEYGDYFLKYGYVLDRKNWQIIFNKYRDHFILKDYFDDFIKVAEYQKDLKIDSFENRMEGLYMTYYYRKLVVCIPKAIYAKEMIL